MALPNEPFGGQYQGRRVLITGASGFKGSWLAIWLKRLGAKVFGYSSQAQREPSLFSLANVAGSIEHHDGDIRDLETLRQLVAKVKPEVIFHLAAQPLVRQSYREPLETLSVNVLGTATVLEAVRQTAVSAAVVVVTSDKCYENRNWAFGYRETDALGGHDPYSMSKACAELVASSWQRSYFGGESIVRVATARAGNVIGGGDWSADRIVTDCIDSLRHHRPIGVRFPHAERPWQHALEALSGYLQLGARLTSDRGGEYVGPWNFGPDLDGIRPVRDLVTQLIAEWGSGTWVDQSDPTQPHEAQTLALCCDKSRRMLGWRPVWSFEQAIAATAHWYRDWHEGATDILRLCESQIDQYAEQAGLLRAVWANGG